MTIDEILAAMREIVDGAQGRNLTSDEVTRYEDLEEQLAAAQTSDEVRGRQTAYETPVHDNFRASATGQDDDRVRNPLAYTEAALESIQNAIHERRSERIEAGLRPENATLTTGGIGSRRVWGANVVNGPRILHVVAGVPTQPAEAIFAQFPQLTIPTASPAVGEGVSLVEYASSTAGSVTLGRFGRWTDLTEESLIGASADPIIGMHQLGVAKDLDKVLIDAVESAAGAAVAFTADVPAAIRSAIARVLDATATENPEDLVILTHADNAALLQDVTPTGGNTIGERFQRFSGALVYPSSAVDTGFMTVANLRIAVRYFEAMGMRTVTDTAVKTDVTTVATAVISGYALQLANGFASKVDVVTP